jgi:hypothetical protein
MRDKFNELSCHTEVRRLKKLNSGESPPNDEQLRKRRASLIKIGAVMILAFIVWVFSSIAWFTINKDVGTGGMSIQTANMPFDIATKGTNVRNH